MIQIIYFLILVRTYSLNLKYMTLIVSDISKQTVALHNILLLDAGGLRPSVQYANVMHITPAPLSFLLSLFRFKTNIQQ